MDGMGFLGVLCGYRLGGAPRLGTVVAYTWRIISQDQFQWSIAMVIGFHPQDLGLWDAQMANINWLYLWGPDANYLLNWMIANL